MQYKYIESEDLERESVTKASSFLNLRGELETLIPNLVSLLVQAIQVESVGLQYQLGERTQEGGRWGWDEFLGHSVHQTKGIGITQRELALQC